MRSGARCLVVLFLWAQVLPAFAGFSDVHEDEGEAYLHALANVAIADPSQWCTSTAPHKVVAGSGEYRVTNQAGNVIACTGVIDTHIFHVACASRSKSGSGLVNSAVASSICRGGCAYDLGEINESFDFKDTRNNISTAKRGRYAPTGAVCKGDDYPAPPDHTDDFCQDLEGGHKQCRKPGKTCIISGTTGREYCWKDGYSGPAVDPNRNEAVSKSPEAAAPGLPAPLPTPRPGENWSANGPASSITNNTTNKITNINTSANTGTPNTNPNDATPGDGSDNTGTKPGEAGTGEGEGQGPSQVSGGGDCASQPLPSYIRDDDTLLMAIWKQEWLSQCEGSDYDMEAALVEGDALAGVVEGEDADPGNPEFDADNDPLAGARSVVDLSTIELDESGFLAAGQCPTLPSVSVGAATIPFDLSPICGLMVSLSGIIMAISYIIAFRIIAGGFN